MSHRLAVLAINIAKGAIRRHKSGNPECQLSDEELAELREQIELAESHIGDLPIEQDEVSQWKTK